MNTSVVGKTANQYYGAYDRFLKWKNSKSSKRTPDLHYFAAVAYLVHIFDLGQSESSALQFLGGFNLMRLLHGLPRLPVDGTTKGLFAQILAAFRKRHRIAQIPLPKVVVMRQLLLGFKQLPFIHVLFLFAYWLAVSLALRSDEVFLLDPKYVSMTKDEVYIVWPDLLLGNGIKSGKIRLVLPYAVPLLKFFMQFPVNPFLSFVKARVNIFLRGMMNCTMQSARHCGAHFALHYTKDLPTVQKVLGHANLLCARYYIDFWKPEVGYEEITALVITALKTGPQ